MELLKEILISGMKTFWSADELTTYLLVDFVEILDGILRSNLILTYHSDTICFRFFRAKSGTRNALLKLLTRATQGLVVVAHEVQAASSLLILRIGQLSRAYGGWPIEVG